MAEHAIALVADENIVLQVDGQSIVFGQKSSPPSKTQLWSFIIEGIAIVGFLQLGQVDNFPYNLVNVS